MADPGLYVDIYGNIVDLRDIRRTFSNVLDSLTHDFKIPLVNFNPLQMLHVHDLATVAQAPTFRLIGRGETQPLIAGSPLSESLIYAHGKVSRLMAPEAGPIAEDMYLASNRFGILQRTVHEMAGTYIPERTPRQGILGHAVDKIQDTLDIGRQQHPSIFSEWLSFLSKFNDDSWVRNRANRLMSGELQGNEAAEAIESIARFLDSRSEGFSDEIWDVLRRYNPEIFGEIADFDLSSADGVINTLRRLATDKSTVVSSNYYPRLKGSWNRYVEAPDAFVTSQRMVRRQAIFDRHQTFERVSRLDDVRKVISKEWVHQYGTGRVAELSGVLEAAYQAGEITRQSLRAAQDLITSTIMDEMLVASKSVDVQDAIQQVVEFLAGHTERSRISRERILNMVYRNATIWSRGSRRGGSALPSSDWLLMRRAVTPLDVVRAPSKFGAFVSQFFAGRKNMADVTTATVFPFYIFERLNRGLETFGLGLSPKSMSSPQALFGNLLLRRVAPVVLGITGLQYLSYEFEKLTGKDFDDLASSALANVQLDLAKLRDRTGITSFAKRLKQLTPGGEQIAELPGVNWVHASMTEEELREHLRSGVEPVRSGRYWTLGNTPFTGGKIEYYRPTWYRRAQSDYQFTDVKYGSKDEYWANHWMPTPRYPGAPIRHFITDPYHYELKHYYTRPYPMTGRLGHEIPLIGPVISATIGRILKPQRPMHVEEVARAMATTGGKPGIPVRVGKHGVPIVVHDGEREVPEGHEYLYVTPSGNVEARRFVQVHPGSHGDRHIHMTTAQIDEQIRMAPKKRSGVIMRPRRDAEIVFVQEGHVAMPYDVSHVAGETYYRLTEMAGIYGFATETLLGEGPATRPHLASADEITSWRRAFWDMELGGLGGELSEIVRRFIPNKPYAERQAEINPIRNTMPTWMPGPNYYLDFQHGDPYAKIPGGEYRLPGPGYEALNELHPDEFGRYGAFDRFKILADVAPYSEEYEYYKEIIEQADLPPELRREASAIKRRVSTQKKQRRLYPYRFKTSNIEKREVTVTRVIDSNTFMTEEFPGHPIRLAGVYVGMAKDDPKAQKARQLLSRHIYPGAKLTIGINADPLHQVRDDTYHTIHAVVYSGGQNINRMLLERELAKEKTTDYSPEAVHARFTPLEIAFGKAWETVAHADTRLNTKLLQVRSPLESYKRRDLYGKDWQSWSRPIQDFLIPTYESYITKHPIAATMTGAFFGSLFGRTRKGKVIGATVGGLFVGLGSLRRALYERRTGEAWIPKRARLRRELESYFDVLEYVKYRGLYEKTLEEARRHGIDAEGVIEQIEAEGEANKRERKRLEAEKRRLYRLGTHEARKQITELNKQLKEIASRGRVIEVDPYTRKALEYKSAYESTLYGAEPGAPLGRIMRSIPKPERYYFNDFLNAPEEERAEILRLVPKNLGRILRRHWGEGDEPRPDLEEFFKDYYLPSPSWAGWRPDVNLDDIKLKVIRDLEQDFIEYGYWHDDVERVENSDTPDLRSAGGVDPNRIREALNSILKGEGLTDIQIHIAPSEDDRFLVDFDLTYEREQEIRDMLNSQSSRMF